MPGLNFSVGMRIEVVVNGERTRNAIDGVDFEVVQRVERGLPHLRSCGERKTRGPCFLPKSISSNLKMQES